MAHFITRMTVHTGVHGQSIDVETPFTQRSLIRRYSFALRFFLTLALLAWLVYQVDVRAALDLWLNVSPGWLAFSIAIMATARVGRCTSWAQILKLSGFARPGLYSRLIRLYFAGGFVGAVFPSSATADAMRVLLAQRLLRASLGELTASAFLLNALTCLAACTVGLIGIGLLLMEADLGHLDFLPTAAAVFGGFFIAIAGLCAAAAWISRNLPNRVWPIQVPVKVRLFVEELFAVLSRLKQPVRHLPPLLALAILALLCVVLSMIGLGIGLGIAVPFAAYVVAVPLTMMVSLLPASVLGFGALQLFHVYFFRYFGIEETEALAISALQTTVAVGIHIALGAGFFCSLKGCDKSSDE